MFSRKNPTPREVAFLACGYVTLVVSILLFFIKVSVPESISWELLGFIPFLIFIIGYLIFALLLKSFIYWKIKLIYKTIHQLKASKHTQSNSLNLGRNILEEVEQEVNQWAQDQTAEIENLKRMEQFRRDFLGNVSHELKTPIFNLQGYLYTLLEGGLEDEGIRIAYLQKAVNNLERLHTIVEDLNIISQLESNELQMDVVKFNLHDLVREIFDDMEMKAREKRMRLSFKEDADGVFYVVADRDRIRQVLNNLLINAINYGKEKGRVLVSFYDMDRNILIEITDNGRGIAPDHLPRLFERFYRVDKGRSREHGGTGLGLAIVKHIIEAHGQTVNVRSKLDVGSTFGFTLEKAH